MVALSYIILISTAFRQFQIACNCFLLSREFFPAPISKMPTDPTVSATADLDDESYNSSEDEDFQLEGAQDDSDLSSDDDAAEPAQKKRKTNKKSEAPEDDLDSGDEVTIRKAREKLAKKRKGKKSKGKNGADDDMDLDDDEGGTGGFVRTRAMKQQM